MWSVGVITYVLLSGNECDITIITIFGKPDILTSQGYPHSWGILTLRPSPTSPPVTTLLTRISLMLSGKSQPASAVCQFPH